MNRHEANVRRFWNFSDNQVKKLSGFRFVDSLIQKSYEQLTSGEKHMVQMFYSKFIRDIKSEPTSKTGSQSGDLKMFKIQLIVSNTDNKPILTKEIAVRRRASTALRLIEILALAFREAFDFADTTE